MTMDFDKLYDMFCEYYKDDGSNDVIMKGRIEKAFLKYAQKLVKGNVDLASVVGQSGQYCECTDDPMRLAMSLTKCAACQKIVED